MAERCISSDASQLDSKNGRTFTFEVLTDGVILDLQISHGKVKGLSRFVQS